jgi:hypothetical protein
MPERSSTSSRGGSGSATATRSSDTATSVAFDTGVPDASRGTENSSCGLSASAPSGISTVNRSADSSGQRCSTASRPDVAAKPVDSQFGRGWRPTCRGVGTSPYSTVRTRSDRNTSR